MDHGYKLDEVFLRPYRSELKSRRGVDLTTKITRTQKIEVPVISAPMSAITGERMARAMADSGGIGFIHRYMSQTEQCNIARRLSDEGIPFGVSISNDLNRAFELIDSGATLITADIAHGWSKSNMDVLSAIRKKYDFDEVGIISGNITEQAALKELSAYVDAVRVGIGEGAACVTRDVAGVNVPLATCLKELMDTRRKLEHDVKLIVDGGIRTTGDIVKSLAMGADAVISGYLFKGLNECEHQEYFGMASKKAMEIRAQNDPDFDYQESIHTTTPEGMVYEYQLDPGESVAKKMEELKSGIQIGFSYLGARNIKELRGNASFITRNPC